MNPASSDYGRKAVLIEKICQNWGKHAFYFLIQVPIPAVSGSRLHHVQIMRPALPGGASLRHTHHGSMLPIFIDVDLNHRHKGTARFHLANGSYVLLVKVILQVFSILRVYLL